MASQTDYGAPSPRRSTTATLTRSLLTATHLLHFASSVIVMSIAAYFIANFPPNNTHLRYWVAVGAVDAFLYLPALVLPMLKSYKGYLAPLACIFSYLWLTAFIFAVQDYEYNGGAYYNSPAGVDRRALKRTVEAFAFLAFFTSLVATFLETRLWDVNRARGVGSAFHSDKHSTVPPAANAA